MIRPILLHPDPVLRRRCAPVGAPGEAARRLVTDLLETMYDAPGRGLAAPQVGVALRVFVVDVSWKEGAPSPIAMIDPEIEEASPELCVMEEACLSIPDRPRRVERPAEVTMSWTDPSGERLRRCLAGAEARCAQHELDHLDGVLILDHPPA